MTFEDASKAMGSGNTCMRLGWNGRWVGLVWPEGWFYMSSNYGASLLFWNPSADDASAADWQIRIS